MHFLAPRSHCRIKCNRSLVTSVSMQSILVSLLVAWRICACVLCGCCGMFCSDPQSTRTQFGFSSDPLGFCEKKLSQHRLLAAMVPTASGCHFFARRLHQNKPIALPSSAMLSNGSCIHLIRSLYLECCPPPSMCRLCFAATILLFALFVIHYS